MHHVLTFAGALLAFVALDMVWLAVVGGPLFMSQVGTVLRERPDLAAAGTFYLIYGVGMATLVVAPALRERSVLSAAWRGAVLGLTAYATFDLTNLAIVRDWTLTVSLADMAWGTCATGLACLAGYGAGHWATRTDGDRL